jgi:hypothetical protein
MIILAGCGLPDLPVVVPSATLPSLEAATPDSEPAVTSPPTPSSTVTLTATPSEPVFDLSAVGDNRLLDSFVLTRTRVTTGGGQVKTYQQTVRYIRDPFSASDVSTNAFLGEIHQGVPKIVIEGRWYERIGHGPWYFFLYPHAPSEVVDDLLRQADMRQGNAHLIASARFEGSEDFGGLPAYRFTMERTSLSDYTDATGTYRVDSAQGEIYLSQAEGFLLYFHIKLAGNVYNNGSSPEYQPGTYEVTEELSSIDQVNEVPLPADFPEFELDLGLPLPPGVDLDSILKSDDGRDHDTYMHFMSDALSYEEFYDFYRSLAPTGGWNVASIGPLGGEYQDLCQSHDCVTLKRGSEQFVLSFPALCESDMPANHICMAAYYSK